MTDYTGILTNIAQDFNSGHTAEEITFKYRVNLNQLKIWANSIDKNSPLYRTIQRFLSAYRLYLLGKLPDGGNTADVVVSPTLSGSIDNTTASGLQMTVDFSLANATTGSIDWGDGNVDPITGGDLNGGEFVHVYNSTNTYTITLSGNDQVLDTANVYVSDQTFASVCNSATAVDLNQPLCGTADGTSTYWMEVTVPDNVGITITSTVAAFITTQTGGCLDPFYWESGASPLSVAPTEGSRLMIISVTPDAAGSFCVTAS